MISQAEQKSRNVAPITNIVFGKVGAKKPIAAETINGSMLVANDNLMTTLNSFVIKDQSSGFA